MSTEPKSLKDASDEIIAAVIYPERCGVTSAGEPWAVSRDGLVKVVWVDLGEGLSGDYDPEDPEDESLLRYDAYVRWDQENPSRNELRDLELDPFAEDGNTWAVRQDSSYCTQTRADTPIEDLHALALLIAEALADDLDNGSWKRTAEEMSWVSPHWLRA